MITELIAGFGSVLQVHTLMLMTFGSIWGIVFAAIPGLSTGMAVVLALPLTYGMSSVSGLATLAGIYLGGMSGGLIGSTLLGIPGTASAVATTFDGFPMARAGFPGKAMGIGIWSSFFGGVFGALILVVSAPTIARFATRLGPWEYTSLVILGMTMIASLSGKNVLKGFIAGVFGVLAGTVGADPIFGASRLAFGSRTLRGGLHFIPVMIGLFAISQLLVDLEKNHTAERYSGDRLRIPNGESLRILVTNMRALIIASLGGLFIGALPGVGASISNIWAYDQIKRLSPRRAHFGTGEPEGIIAAEASNSATAGGTLIPMLALGLPGNPISVIMMGAVMIHGITPGPLFISRHPDIAYGLFAAFIVVNFLVLICQLLFTRFYVKVLSVPIRILAPIVIVFCVIGAFAHNSRLSDVYIMFGSGIVGYALTRLRIPLAPAILGLILGPTLEENIRISLMTTNSFTPFFTRPISALFLVMAFISVVIIGKEQWKGTQT